MYIVETAYIIRLPMIAPDLAAKCAGIAGNVIVKNVTIVPA